MANKDINKKSDTNKKNTKREIKKNISRRKYIRSKKSTTVKSTNVKSKTVAEEIDKLFDEATAREKVDEIEKEKVDIIVPTEKSLVIAKEDDSLEKEDDKTEESQTEENNIDTKVISKNNRYISYNERLIAHIVCIVLLFIIGVSFVISSISIKSNSSVLYNQSSNIDYKVYLQPNDYYKEPYLDKNMQYIANLIDNIDVNFNYIFNANQNINYEYSYYVMAETSVTDSQDKAKVIYSKSDKVIEPVSFKKNNSNGFIINQNVKVNYSQYNDLVKSFKSSYAISADSNLVLSLCVQIKDEKGNIIRNYDTDKVSLKITLSEQMINISMDSKPVNNSNNNVNVYKSFFISNKVLFGVGIASFIASILFTFKLILFVNKTSVKKSIYDVTLAKILREYDRVIVNSKKMLNVDNSNNIIDVNNFSELLDVRDNLEKPIVFYEIHKGQKSVFLVKTSSELYRYVLKLSDLERNSKNGI